MSKHKGKVSPNRIDPKLKATVIDLLCRKGYPGFGSTLAIVYHEPPISTGLVFGGKVRINWARERRIVAGSRIALIMELFRSPIWLKFYPCFPRFDLFKSAYTLAGYVTFKKIKPALQGLNFNKKAKIETVPLYVIGKTYGEKIMIAELFFGLLWRSNIAVY